MWRQCDGIVAGRHNCSGVDLVRMCGGQTIGHVDLHSGLPVALPTGGNDDDKKTENRAKRAETMLIGLYRK